MGREVIAIDLGGSNLRIAKLDGKRIIKLIEIKTRQEKKKLLDDIVNYTKDLMTKNVKAIGVGAPGPMENGKILNSPNLILKNFDLKKFLRQKFKGVRVEVENDANCVALAEADCRVRKKNFIVLTLGTGIGGAIILNGELYGKDGYAGEFGYMVLDHGEYFENLAASKAVKKLSKKYLGREMHLEDVLKIKNRKSERVTDEITKYIGQGIANLINIFAPEAVVLSGGFSQAGNAFLTKIKKHTRRYVFVKKNWKIEYSKLNEPGILGAALLVK